MAFEDDEAVVLCAGIGSARGTLAAGLSLCSLRAFKFVVFRRAGCFLTGVSRLGAVVIMVSFVVWAHVLGVGWPVWR